jgi:hypothetical protein
VDRTVVKMAMPTKVGIMVKKTGGTETFVMLKALCGGKWVLLAHVIKSRHAPQAVTSVTMWRQVGAISPCDKE